MKPNKGFTIAEVLITLVIIGIIAAISIPAICANVRRHEISTRLKKFYASMSNASIMAKSKGYDWEIWAENAPYAHDTSSQTTGDFAKQYLLPFLNYMKAEFVGIDYYIYLTDGSYFYFRKNNCLDFYFDVNGKRMPNIQGKDIFTFLYCPYSITDNDIVKSGRFSTNTRNSMTTRQQYLEACKTQPVFCSTLVMLDGWDFKSDYPYKI